MRHRAAQQLPHRVLVDRDPQGDRTSFGVEIVKAIASPRVKLLYDAYHMQIMEGDIIRTIRDNREHIAHFHTGGVPALFAHASLFSAGVQRSVLKAES